MRMRKAASNITEETLSRLGFPEAEVSVFFDNEALNIDIKTDDAGILIGKKGDTLRSLQHALLLIISRTTGETFPPGTFSLDINDYKKQRKQYLASLAHSTAEKVQRTGSPHELDPMPAVERRLVHLALSSVEGVTTQSVGERDERRVIVRPESI